MYGRMQFAAYIASYALQANTDCLRTLAAAEQNADGALSANGVAQLRRDSERLLSLWQMMHWSVGKVPYGCSVERLQEVQRLLPVDTGWIERAGRELLAKVEDPKSAADVEIACREVTGNQVPSSVVLDLDRLSCVFQTESECWRDSALLRKVQDYDLIEHGIGRAYGKSHRFGVRLLKKPHKPKRLRRANRWVRHSINHLELLGSALSQGNKTRAWFLNRLGMNLTKRLDVMRFSTALSSLELKPKLASRLDRLAETRRRRLEVQTAKLLAGAFQDDDEAFIRSVASDVKKLGLQELVLLPVAETNNEA